MKRDLLLCFYEADLYRARWSETIQQEWLRHAIDRNPTKEANLQRTDRLMREHFAEAWIEDFDRFIPTVELPDPDDRHVVAAAIACNAQYIVTDNIKHFPEEDLSALHLEAGTADKFLAGTVEHYPARSFEVIREHRNGLRSAPTASAYLMDLISKGLPLLASRLRANIAAI